MKKSFLFLALVLGTWLAARAQDPIQAKSTITDVTVYLNGAQVTEEATVNLDKGDNIVLFSGLGDAVDPRSIQAVAPDIVLINSVRHEINYLQQHANNPRVQRLQDSLKTLQERQQELANEKTVLTLEQTMLSNNQSLAGEAKGVSTDELRRAADFFRARQRDISDRLLTNARAQAKLGEDRNRITNQLTELRALGEKPSHDIVVKLRADYARSVRIGIRYLVGNAGWTPGYDLRAKDTENPITLDYRADVWQNTGADWKNVLLTLSTGDPNQGGTKPELTQWNLSFSSPGGYAGWMDADKTANDESALRQKVAEMAPRGSRTTTLSEYTVMRNTATTAEFAISVKQDIPSGGKPQQVSIQSATLPAVFEHYAVPKLDKDAFLVARVTGWESLNLMPGTVNIFFEGTYVTQAILDPTATIDTLDFSLGRDKKVIIERNMLQDHNAKRDIGINRERTFGYEFVLRNTKRSVVHLKLLDQVPVSQDASIEVKVDEISGASKDEATGILTWDLDLQPAATQKLRLIYSVKHPKKKVVPGL